LYRPETVHKFDTTIQVDILGWKTVSLRMGGQVEYPVVDLDVVSISLKRGLIFADLAPLPYPIFGISYDLASLLTLARSL